MGKCSLSMRLTLLSLSLSLSLSLTASFSSSTPFFRKPSSTSLSPSPSSTPKATPSDLLSLLGPKSQSSTIDPLIAQDLKSCLKFLVPFAPPKPKIDSRKCLTMRKDLGSIQFGGRSQREEDELIWWPPEPVLELARLAVDSGGDPAAIHRALDPAIITIIVARGPTIGLDISLDRYDFFHGHLFLAIDTGRLGILFHAKEYPAYDKERFPYNMGYCQIGSNVKYDDSMNLRNILWLAPLPSNLSKAWVAPGVLVVLDAYPEGVIYRDLIPEYVRNARTIYEDDLGDIVVDINYLNVGDAVPDYQIFIC